MFTLRVKSALLAAFAWGVTASCGESTGPIASIAFVAVVPANATLTAVGDTVRFTVEARDSAGALVTGVSIPISWSSSNTGAATIDASSGLATAVANGVTIITASSSATDSTRSATLTVSIGGGGGPTQLGVQVQPGGAVTGQPFPTQPAVAVQDAGGGVVTSDNSTVVTAAIASGSGNLGGTLTATASAGVATFTNLQIDAAGTHSIVFTAPGLTAATSAIFEVLQPGSAAPIWQEDFSGYTSTNDLLMHGNNPWAFTNVGPGGDIELDQNLGFGSSTQSMRYDYPDNDDCGNYTIGRAFHDQVAPYNQLQDFWVEYIIQFSSNWRTAQPNCAGGFADHKTIEIFPLPTGTRWEVKIGAGGAGFQQSSPEFNSGNNEAPVNLGPPYDALTFWDDTWKVVRVQVGNFGSGTSNGIWRIWFDNGTGMRLVHEETNLLYEPSGVGIRQFWIGQNRNLGQNEAMSWWVGRMRIYDQNPGW